MISKVRQVEALLTFGPALPDAGSVVNGTLAQWLTVCRMFVPGRVRIGRLGSTVHDMPLLMRYGPVNLPEVLVADCYSETEGAINLYRALGGCL